MALGPGKYDAECMHVFRRTKAHAAVVIVIGGDRGNGFSVTADQVIPMDQIADILEQMLRSMRSDLAPKGRA